MPITPGPWRTQPATQGIDPKKEVVVAVLGSIAVVGPAGEGDAASDAALIAMAPTLLAELETGVQALPPQTGRVNHWKRLIAKAKSPVTE